MVNGKSMRRVLYRSSRATGTESAQGVRCCPLLGRVLISILRRELRCLIAAYSEARNPAMPTLPWRFFREEDNSRNKNRRYFSLGADSWSCSHFRPCFRQASAAFLRVIQAYSLHPCVEWPFSCLTHWSSVYGLCAYSWLDFAL